MSQEDKEPTKAVQFKEAEVEEKQQEKEEEEARKEEAKEATSQPATEAEMAAAWLEKQEKMSSSAVVEPELPCARPMVRRNSFTRI